jgi:hypothetical protein
MIELRTIIKTLLEKHLSNQIVADKMNTVFTDATKRYKEKWIQQIT